jgi:hypothetical protein
MGRRFAEIAFTPAVKEEQERHGSRRQYQRVEELGELGDTLGPHERAFIQPRDGFYMSTISETGWPYIEVPKASSRSSTITRWDLRTWAATCSTSARAT